jgi:hypothetical protein
LEEKVEFIVVGAYALGAHGYPRATGDIDIWIEPTADNARRVIRSLNRFGVPLFDVDEEDFTREGIVFQIGVAPRRIDIITAIDGVEFRSAHGQKLEISVEGMSIPVLSLEDLIKNKESTGREKDSLDAKMLKKRMIAYDANAADR